MLAWWLWRVCGSSGAAASTLQLRAIFPNADAFKLALREPFLVYGSTIFRLQRAASELRSLLPGLDIDRWGREATWATVSWASCCCH